MHYDENSRVFNYLVGFALGAVLGAGLAVLMAPQSGRRTRRQIMRAVSDAREMASDRFGELAHDVRSAVDAGRRRLNL